MSEFMEEFMREMRAVFPKLLVQFEVWISHKFIIITIPYQLFFLRISQLRRHLRTSTLSENVTPFSTMTFKERVRSSFQALSTQQNLHLLRPEPRSGSSAFSSLVLALQAWELQCNWWASSSYKEWAGRRPDGGFGSLTLRVSFTMHVVLWLNTRNVSHKVKKSNDIISYAFLAPLSFCLGRIWNV